MKRAYEMGDHIRSLRDSNITGPVIGFGTIQWESETETAVAPVLVYLVQRIARGSSTLGPAVAVLRADQVEGRWEEEESK